MADSGRRLQWCIQRRQRQLVYLNTSTAKALLLAGRQIFFRTPAIELIAWPDNLKTSRRPRAPLIWRRPALCGAKAGLYNAWPGCLIGTSHRPGERNKFSLNTRQFFGPTSTGPNQLGASPGPLPSSASALTLSNLAVVGLIWFGCCVL